MTTIGATPLPAYVSLPPGVTANAGSNGSAPSPAAIIDVRTPLPGAAITAEAGDHFALWDLFSAGREAWGVTMQYRVALRADPGTPSGGRLLLDGSDVSDRMDFTRDEFLRLRFEAGAQGSRTDLLVVARRVGSGGAVTDSPAVQVTATTTGSRSLNAAEALRTEAGEDEAAFVRIAKEAALYRATGTGGPTLTTVGNFTAEAADHFALWDLFSAGREAWGVTMQYRVALRADPGTPSGGRLLLDGSDVSDRMDFTRDEFLRLRFEAGAQGSRTDLLVVARRVGSGGAVTDSPAVQVTATTTGSRSLNAAEALRTEAGEDEAAFVRIAKEAALYRATGTGGPTLTTVGKPPGPALPADDLVFRLGAFQAIGWRGASTAFNPAQFYSDAVGAADVQTANTAAANDRTRLLIALLLGNEVGGVQVAPNVTGQSLLALQAYLRAQS